MLFCYWPNIKTTLVLNVTCLLGSIWKLIHFHEQFVPRQYAIQYSTRTEFEASTSEFRATTGLNEQPLGLAAN